VTTFGPSWSRALCEGCATMSVPPEWVLAVFALESGFNPLARSAAGARGLWQRMPSKSGVEYPTTDPVEQLRDAFKFWRLMTFQFRVPAITSRAALYCLNFAPARLQGGAYDDATELYAAPSAAYRMNAAPFGLDPKDPNGVLRMKHLAHGLDTAVRRCRARYDAELEAAAVASVTPPAAP